MQETTTPRRAESSARRSTARRQRVRATGLSTLLAGAAILLVFACTTGSRQAFAALGLIELQVDARTGSAGDFAAAQDGQELAVGDDLRTDPSGYAEVKYADGSQTRLGANTEFSLVELADGPPQVRGQLDIGRTWNRVKDLSQNGGEFEIETTVGTAAVRGTVFIAICLVRDVCTFGVIEGVVDIILPDGTVITLRAGEQVTVDRDGVVGGIEPLHVFTEDDELDPDDPVALWIEQNADEDDFGGIERDPLLAFDPPDGRHDDGEGADDGDGPGSGGPSGGRDDGVLAFLAGSLGTPAVDQPAPPTAAGPGGSSGGGTTGGPVIALPGNTPAPVPQVTTTPITVPTLPVPTVSTPVPVTTTTPTSPPTTVPTLPVPSTPTPTVTPTVPDPTPTVPVPTPTVTPTPGRGGSSGGSGGGGGGGGGSGGGGGGGTLTVVADTFDVTNSSTRTLDVLGNDVGATSITAATTPTSGGSVVCGPHDCAFTPLAGFTGTDTFTYTATDGSQTSTAVVTVTVTECADIAGAVSDQTGLVTDEDWIQCSADDAIAVTSLTPTSMTRTGPALALLTTGDAALAGTPNDSDSSGRDNLTAAFGDAQDVSKVRLGLSVPGGHNCLSFDLVFASEEFDEFVGSSFNDAFLAELDTSNWSVSGTAITAPNNFALDPDSELMSVNSALFDQSDTGTTYDGSTSQVTVRTAVTSGPHDLYLSIFDVGDGIFDSAAFVDGVRTSNELPGDCVAGAVSGPPPTPAITGLLWDETASTPAAFAVYGSTLADLTVDIVDNVNDLTDTTTADADGMWAYETTLDDELSSSILTSAADLFITATGPGGESGPAEVDFRIDDEINDIDIQTIEYDPATGSVTIAGTGTPGGSWDLIVDDGVSGLDPSTADIVDGDSDGQWSITFDVTVAGPSTFGYAEGDVDLFMHVFGLQDAIWLRVDHAPVIIT